MPFKPGHKPFNPASRVKRSEKFAAFVETWSRLKKRWTGNKYGEGRVRRGEAGNLRALVELKCLDCVCGVVTEIRECPILGCPLWPVRPFQTGTNDDDSDDSSTETLSD